MCSGPASRAVRLVIRYTVSVLVSVTRLRVFPSPFHQVTVRVRMTLATCLTCGNLAVISSGASMTRWERVSRRPWPRSFVLCRRGGGAGTGAGGGGRGGGAGGGVAAAVAAVLRLVPAGAGPAQCLQGGVQERLVALDGQDPVGLQFLAGQREEPGVRVECAGGQDPPGEGEPLVQAAQHGADFRDLVRLHADLPLGDHDAAGGGRQQE